MIRKGLYVSKFEGSREVKPFTVFEDKDKLLLDVNTFGFEQTSKLVEDLKGVLDGDFKYEYEWAGPRVSFESKSDQTIVKDMIFKDNSLTYSTLDLYKILSDRFVYLCQLTEESIMLKVEGSFNKIRLNSEVFSLEQNRFRIIDQEQIDFILMPNDILLSKEEFISQIKINKKFLKLDSTQPA